MAKDITINLNPAQLEALKAYKQEYFEQASDIETAKENIKEIIEAAVEATGLEKKILTKHYAVSFNEKLPDVLEEASILEFLSEQ